MKVIKVIWVIWISRRKIPKVDIFRNNQLWRSIFPCSIFSSQLNLNWSYFIGALTNQRRNRKTNSFESITEEEEGKINRDYETVKFKKNSWNKGQIIFLHYLGVDYPLDIWFIISEYISPEAVGKFAQICRSSYHVVTTGKFWFHLYKT